MNYPHGPHGQGFPGQPVYGRPPSYPQQPGWPQQPTYPHAGPSGATGIIAGLLALVGGLVGTGFAVLSVIIMIMDGEFDVAGAVFGLLGIAFGLALLIGAILLFRRKTIGRRLVVGGCAVAVLFGVAAIGDMVIGISGDASREPVSIGIAVIVGIVVPVLTLVLAMLPSTSAWIRAKRNAIAPQFYPPYPG
jgi:hypothetical protein